ncbi:DUF4870 domain-containing protein [Demequina sp.]|uniref:DUF4870 domain-containing protein n=1 Tax=Demequina sp. TaxID=2050685 RepID=UPI0025BF323F|nr:DUF4870 domain-containing protein [Demequina sp.]
MTYTAPTVMSAATAGIAHLSALTGPVVPLVIYATRRRTDVFVSSEAAKAANFSAAVVAVFILATLVRELVPLIGFLGTLGQWVVPVVAIYFSLAGFWVAKQGKPAHYPYQLKVVKTHD